MKKRFAVITALVCIMAVFACLFLPASADKVQNKTEIKAENLLEARFLNMLNRNFVYGRDFENADLVAEDSLLALLGMRDESEPDYIEEKAVIGFVGDMYGIELKSIKDNSAMHKDGFVYVAPCGFTGYSHEITDITENEDGTFTVLSKVTVTPHDDTEYQTEAETLFVKNEKSAFGYNIVYSDIKGEANAI